MNILQPKKKLAIELKRYLKREGITQIEAQSHQYLNVSQSTISRVINGNWKRPTRMIFSLAQKLDVDMSMYHDPMSNKKLVNALKDVWDGSDEGATMIAAIIKNIPKLFNQV